MPRRRLLLTVSTVVAVALAVAGCTIPTTKDGGGYGRKPGWGDSGAARGGRGDRGDRGGFAPRDGFAPRGNGAGHGAPGKAFVPRDAQKRAFKPSR